MDADEIEHILGGSFQGIELFVRLSLILFGNTFLFLGKVHIIRLETHHIPVGPGNGGFRRGAAPACPNRFFRGDGIETGSFGSPFGLGCIPVHTLATAVKQPQCHLYIFAQHRLEHIVQLTFRHAKATAGSILGEAVANQQKLEFPVLQHPVITLGGDFFLGLKHCAASTAVTALR